MQGESESQEVRGGLKTGAGKADLAQWNLLVDRNSRKVCLRDVHLKALSSLLRSIAVFCVTMRAQMCTHGPSVAAGPGIID